MPQSDDHPIDNAVHGAMLGIIALNLRIRELEDNPGTRDLNPEDGERQAYRTHPGGWTTHIRVADPTHFFVVLEPPENHPEWVDIVPDLLPDVPDGSLVREGLCLMESVRRG